jgi:hypothetical protein
MSTQLKQAQAQKQSIQAGRPCPSRTINRDLSLINRMTSFLVELIESSLLIGG